ncbi:MAG: glycosyltransferase [Pseudomonadota bacterium]
MHSSDHPSDLGSTVDLLVAADFRLPGGTSQALAHEIRFMPQDLLPKTAFRHFKSQSVWEGRPWNPTLKSEVDARGLRMLTAGEDVTARTVVIHNPMAIRFRVPRLARKAERIIVVAHQVPRSRTGHFYYDPWQITEKLEALHGGKVVWAPISPACRDALREVCPDLPRLEEDWTNFIDPDEWAAKRDGLRSERPVIGRHGRPQAPKWPATREAILAAYPDDPEFEVRLLGVEGWLERLLGGWPSNWTVHPFNSVSPAEFLRRIDYFVYFHREDWVETFGRTVIEAAAAGAICILPPHFKQTFGDLALYCEATEVKSLVLALHQDEARREEQRAIGLSRVIQRFGPAAFSRRLPAVVGAAPLRLEQSEPALPPARELRRLAARHRREHIWARQRMALRRWTNATIADFVKRVRRWKRKLTN